MKSKDTEELTEEVEITDEIDEEQQIQDEVCNHFTPMTPAC